MTVAKLATAKRPAVKLTAVKLTAVKRPAAKVTAPEVRPREMPAAVKVTAPEVRRGEVAAALKVATPKVRRGEMPATTPAHGSMRRNRGDGHCHRQGKERTRDRDRAPQRASLASMQQYVVGVARDQGNTTQFSRVGSRHKLLPHGTASHAYPQA